MSAPAEVSVGWRYTFCDLLTDTPLAVLPVRDADLTEVIGGAGAGSGEVSLASARVRSLDPWAATTPRRTIMYAQRVVWRNRVEVAKPVLWHGIVWGRTRSGRSIRLTMATPESYYAHRLVASLRRFSQVDDATIMRTLFMDAEDPARFPAGRLGLLYTDTLTGALSDRTLNPAELKTVLDTARSISTAGNGFDWRIAPGLSASGGFTKTLELAPRLGRTGLPELTWQSAAPGRATNELLGYSLEEDGTSVHNYVVGLGDGQAETQLRSIARASDVGNTELSDGYPLLETALSASSDYKLQSTLDRHTQGRLLAGLQNQAQVSGLTVRGDRAPTVDRYRLGDELTLKLNDLLHSSPLTLRGRLVARRFQPAQPGRNDKVGMTLAAT